MSSVLGSIYGKVCWILILFRYKKAAAMEVIGCCTDVDSSTARASKSLKPERCFDFEESHTYLCDTSTAASTETNFCMSDNVFIEKKDDSWQILSFACSDHVNMNGAIDNSSTHTCYSSCGSIDLSCYDIGTYTPVIRTLLLDIPQTAELSESETPVSNHSVVGIAVNGVPYYSGPLIPKFDSCAGHSDIKHSYHYHIPPLCLFQSLGIPIPESNWTDYRSWPATANPSPIVGWSLDNYPIYGPYDENGTLMIGTSNKENTTLNKCNGKIIGTGEWAYFMTPNAPYHVGCFVGKVQGTVMTDEPLQIDDTYLSCPTNGVNNTYTNNSQLLELLTKSECYSKLREYKGPLFLFQYPSPKIGTLPCFRIHAIALGAAHTLLAFIGCFLMLHMYLRRSQDESEESSDLVTLLLVQAATIAKAIFFLVDPYHRNKGAIPALFTAIMFGLPFPALNAAVIFQVIFVAELVTSFQKTCKEALAERKERKDSLMLTDTFARTRSIAIKISILEFPVQFIADIVRWLGRDDGVLMICQVYNFFWAFGLCFINIYFRHYLAKYSAFDIIREEPSMRLFTVDLQFSVYTNFIAGAITAISILNVCGVNDNRLAICILYTAAHICDLITCIFLQMPYVTSLFFKLDTTSNDLTKDVQRAVEHQNQIMKLKDKQATVKGIVLSLKKRLSTKPSTRVAPANPSDASSTFATKEESRHEAGASSDEPEPKSPKVTDTLLVEEFIDDGHNEVSGGAQSSSD